MRLGPYHFDVPVILAPMAGVSDRPFRQLCRAHGADYAVSEMVSSAPALRKTMKTRLRLDRDGEPGPCIVQIAGGDAMALARAVRLNVDEGADVIDINMGCPAKRVCNKMAGSALLRDETLVAHLLEAAVRASAVPVTLKLRTGWDPRHRNGVAVARIAEQAGIQALAVHGRTRACAYQGGIEYETIAAIKAAVSIPVIANGDITTGAQARRVLEFTGADGVMIGRGAQGKPWIFREIKAYLAQGTPPCLPSVDERMQIARRHVEHLHEFYGADIGSRVARKHIAWYAKDLPGGDRFRRTFNTLESPVAQLGFLQNLENNYTGALVA